MPYRWEGREWLVDDPNFKFESTPHIPARVSLIGESSVFSMFFLAEFSYPVFSLSLPTSQRCYTPIVYVTCPDDKVKSPNAQRT